MKGLCAIISGGDFSPLRGIEEAEYVIACDHGFDYAKKCGVKPDLLLGDFDSYSGALPEDIPIDRLPTEKNDTDTMHAFRCAVERGYAQIRLYCALGGRLDHLYSNIQSAAFAAARGARTEIISEDTIIHVFSGGELVLPERKGWEFSVFSVTDVCRGVSISGAKYDLSDTLITNTFPIGESNEWRGTARISAAGGILAVMLCRLPG